MKRADYVVVLCVALVAAFFAFVPGAAEGFKAVSASHAYLMSFVKFAVLATFGECLALRIVAGSYWRPGFGLLAKMVVWGLLGLCINVAFVIFSTGAPNVLNSLGFALPSQPLASPSFGHRLAAALTISVTINLIFAPLLMVLHKITDTHIHREGGALSSLAKAIPMANILSTLDWRVVWGFVLKKTIPFFWIPAHTITFLLPAELRILFAALLGVALGVILAFANLRAPKA